MGTGVVKRRPEEQICPVCVCTAPELQTFFSPVYMLSKIQRESNIPEHKSGVNFTSECPQVQGI